MACHNTPRAGGPLAPDPSVAEGARERRVAKGAGHLHPHAYHGYDSEAMNALLTRIELGDPHPPPPMRVEIVGFSVNRAIRTGKYEGVVKEAIEHGDISGELRLP